MAEVGEAIKGGTEAERSVSGAPDDHSMGGGSAFALGTLVVPARLRRMGVTMSAAREYGLDEDYETSADESGPILGRARMRRHWL